MLNGIDRIIPFLQKRQLNTTMMTEKHLGAAPKNTWQSKGYITSLLLVMMLSVISVISPVNAAIIPAPASTTAATVPQDTFGRDTPRGTVQGFMQALSKDDTMLASRYLNIGNNKNPSLVMREFKAALDGGGKLYGELQISNDPKGNLEDKLTPNIDKVGEIDSPNEPIDITVERVKSGNTQIWLISQTTLQQVSALQANTKPTLVQKYMPKHLLEKEIKGFSVGQILAVIGLLIATYLLSLLLSWLLYLLYRGGYKFWRRKEDVKEEDVPIDKRVIVPMAMVLTAMVIKQSMIVIGISLVLRNLVERMADILSWVALAWLLMRIIDILFRRAQRLAVIGNHPERLSVINLLRKVMKVLLLALATIVILGNLGFDLTTGIAALGIGGLALALGAQKTIENLVGSVSLVADQPINVGDYCKFGTQEGTVEDIGIRSTRIRTSNRTVVTIPNGSFSSMSIENFTSRDMFYFNHIFYISRDSNTAMIREFIEDVQIYITNHPATNSVLNEVRISGTQQDAYLIEVKCYMNAKGVIDFNTKQTDMILKIADLMQENGLNNALPTRQITLQTAKDGENASDGYTI